jgi:hypothetical protein
MKVWNAFQGAQHRVKIFDGTLEVPDEQCENGMRGKTETVPTAGARRKFVGVDPIWDDDDAFGRNSEFNDGSAHVFGDGYDHLRVSPHVLLPPGIEESI